VRLQARVEALESQLSTAVQSELIKQGSTVSQQITHSNMGTHFPPTRKLATNKKLRILVTGGAGFVGSNLVDVLMMQGHHVIVLDNLFTGRKNNIKHWLGHENFEFVVGDVVVRQHTAAAFALFSFRSHPSRSFQGDSKKSPRL